MSSGIFKGLMEGWQMAQKDREFRQQEQQRQQQQQLMMEEFKQREQDRAESRANLQENRQNNLFQRQLQVHTLVMNQADKEQKNIQAQLASLYQDAKLNNQPVDMNLVRKLKDKSDALEQQTNSAGAGIAGIGADYYNKGQQFNKDLASGKTTFDDPNIHPDVAAAGLYAATNQPVHLFQNGGGNQNTDNEVPKQGGMIPTTPGDPSADQSKIENVQSAGNPNNDQDLHSWGQSQAAIGGYNKMDLKDELDRQKMQNEKLIGMYIGPKAAAEIAAARAAAAAHNAEVNHYGNEDANNANKSSGLVEYLDSNNQPVRIRKNVAGNLLINGKEIDPIDAYKYGYSVPQTAQQKRANRSLTMPNSSPYNPTSSTPASDPVADHIENDADTNNYVERQPGQ